MVWLQKTDSFTPAVRVSFGNEREASVRANEATTAELHGGAANRLTSTPRLWRALDSRDARLDGAFVFGVRSTGTPGSGKAIQTAQDLEMFAKRFQRAQGGRQFVVRTFLRGKVVFHDHAVRNVYDAEPV